MKGEIKEILKILKKCEFGACITKHNSRVLLDYITNLQEENKKLKKYYNDNVNMYEDLIIKYNTQENLYKYTPEKGFRLVGDEDE